MTTARNGVTSTNPGFSFAPRSAALRYFFIGSSNEETPLVTVALSHQGASIIPTRKPRESCCPQLQSVRLDCEGPLVAAMHGRYTDSALIVNGGFTVHTPLMNNASKTPYDEAIRVDCFAEQKRAWFRAAKKRKWTLAMWVREVLDRAAESELKGETESY